MADVTLWGATYYDVPAIDVPSGDSTARFYDGILGDDLEYGLTDNTLPLIGVGQVGYMEL